MNKKISLLLAVMLIASGIGIAYADIPTSADITASPTPTPTPIIVTVPTSIDFGPVGANESSPEKIVNIAVSGADARVEITPGDMTSTALPSTPIVGSNIKLSIPSPLIINAGSNTDEGFTLHVPIGTTPGHYEGTIGIVATAI